jgi:hypothetical protein
VVVILPARRLDVLRQGKTRAAHKRGDDLDAMSPAERDTYYADFRARVLADLAVQRGRGGAA